MAEQAGRPGQTGSPENLEDAADFMGEPDGFGRLWVPHRMVYVGGDKPSDDGRSTTCPFCLAPQKTDADGLVVHRGETAFVAMNLYPYSPGHLLVNPYRHVSDYTDLTDAETVEVATLTRQCMRVVRAVSGPAGFNLGLNQGEVAGAGIAAHLHQHVVPRWAGDINFMPIVAQTKPVPQLLEQSRQALVAAWDEHAGS